ncbi:alpha/beta fold hydrolase [Saccharopolyspora griseoalba]|uniref:Alpha/beta fold hydrolase n=1 Tax=Saccharopolyspora griseoalba TaxID=1431848 RepID=A0ABW2LI10_9PSEU
MPTAELGDVRVQYRAEGSGPAVVFVHGLAEDHRTWQAQQDELTGCRTYALDLRGHGGTPVGRASGDLAQLRDDLIAFLSEVSGPAVCAGFSLGGTVVLAAAARRPELVTGAMAIATSSVVGRAAADFFRERAQQVRDGDLEAARATLRADTAEMLTRADAAALGDYRVECIGDGAGYANAALAMAGLREEPLTPLLSKVTCPTVVVGGGKDVFCPRKASEILLDGLPEASYREVPDVGHLMRADDPAGFAEAVRESLGDLGAR